MSRIRKMKNKNQRIIQKMSMKVENRSCFECNFQPVCYVIMNYGIFVCRNCSSIHRTFQHQVKGISVTNFKDDDVKKIEKFGGNEMGRKKWRKKFDPKKDKQPKMNDVNGNYGDVKKFIELTYKEKKWMKDDEDEDKCEKENEGDDDGMGMGKIEKKGFDISQMKRYGVGERRRRRRKKIKRKSKNKDHHQEVVVVGKEPAEACAEEDEEKMKTEITTNEKKSSGNDNWEDMLVFKTRQSKENDILGIFDNLKNPFDDCENQNQQKFSCNNPFY